MVAQPGDGRSTAVLRRLDSLEIAGKRFSHLVAAVHDPGTHNDLNVGTAILKNFLITTDFSERAVWLAPATSLK